MSSHIKIILLLVATIFISSCSISKLPSFSTSPTDISKEREYFKKSKYSILYLLMLNEEGNVVKSRIIARKDEDVSDDTAREFKRQLNRKLQFKPSNKNFREKFYYMSVNTKFKIVE